ncbi:hypothetical protein ES288_D13G136300v1 [Gossypium darwinii]|uniref:RHOMBOID-like protein n=1 Tax=Gossypium darwinii TaxID=34276 RepID=A0A5D1ZYD8_GOSDA|nr:hypothetical protein ES288_D13G136300v1 [Gossypium darwinii]
MPYNFWEIVLPIQSPNCPKNNQGFEGGCVARFLGRLSFEPLKENPLFGHSSNTYDKVVHGNQAWRLITCIWLHAGVIHLLANMLSLIFIGIRLEQEFGFSTLSVPFCSLRVGLIYLLSGFGGSVLSSLFIQRSISHKAYQYLFLVIAMVLLIVGFTVGLVMLFRGENGHDHCSWCHYLSCVPTSKWHCGN